MLSTALNFMTFLDEKRIKILCSISDEADESVGGRYRKSEARLSFHTKRYVSTRNQAENFLQRYAVICAVVR